MPSASLVARAPLLRSKGPEVWSIVPSLSKAPVRASLLVMVNVAPEALSIAPVPPIVPADQVVVPFRVSGPFEVRVPELKVNGPSISELAASVRLPPERTQRVGGRQALDGLIPRVERDRGTGPRDIDDDVVIGPRNLAGAPVVRVIPVAAAGRDPVHGRQQTSLLQELDPRSRKAPRRHVDSPP